MVTKKLLSALALLSTCLGACSSSGSPTDTTENTKAAQITSLACTPLLATTNPFLSCGTLTAANLQLASSVQAQLLTGLQASFASLTIAPDIAANQVILTSTVPQFATFFGPKIIVPLLPDGVFTTTIPVLVDGIAPGFALNATIFGILPGTLNPAFTTTLLPGFTSSATLSASTTATLSSSLALTATTMPLSIIFSSPFLATAPFTCSGSLPLSCL